MNKIDSILEIVNRKRLTAYEIALKTGLSEPGVRKIITGKTKNPNPATIKLILDNLLDHNINGGVKMINKTETEIKNQKGKSNYDLEFLKEKIKMLEENKALMKENKQTQEQLIKAKNDLIEVLKNQNRSSHNKETG